MKFILQFILIYFSIILNVFSMDTKGILEVDKNYDNLRVGETYSFHLTLVPFEIGLVSKSDLVNKRLFEYFYVTDVWSISQSENNSDAVVIELDMVLAKKFEQRDFVIWPLGARNIPVSFKLSPIQDTKLVAQKFTLFPGVLEDSLGNKKILFLVALVILLAGYYITKKLLKNNRKNHRSKETIAYEQFVKASNHDDFEMVFKNRRDILVKLAVDRDVENAFNELILKIEQRQYSPMWESESIEELVELKDKIIEETKRGV